MKSALVTGGSKGIGLSICKTLVNNGFRVTATYNSTEIKDKNISYVKCDVSDINSVKNAISMTGNIDILINCAGVCKSGLVQDITEKDYNFVMDTNLKGIFNTVKCVVPQMIHNKSGKIINISSIWGIYGASAESLYSASKGAVISYTKSLAKELAPSGITANTVCPGVILTDMLNCYSKDELEELKNETPLLRLGTPEDIANTVLFLSQNASDFITGQVITVDGGFTL